MKVEVRSTAHLCVRVCREFVFSGWLSSVVAFHLSHTAVRVNRRVGKGRSMNLQPFAT
jgi:hypothetical protein